jgi:hypothetical protein
MTVLHKCEGDPAMELEVPSDSTWDNVGHQRNGRGGGKSSMDAGMRIAGEGSFDGNCVSLIFCGLRRGIICYRVVCRV